MALIAASLNSQQVSRQLTDLIAQRTNGIPFFIIEFVRMLKENNWLQRLNGKVSIIESNSIPLIPYTLRDLLEKRLDNLAGDMKVVQFASAFGEEFGYDALKSSIGSNSVELNTTLDELLKHDLIRVKRSAGKKNFMFKHELLREAAYNSMPQELKQEAQQLIFYSQQKHLLSSNNDIKPVVLTRRTNGNFTQ
jgi:predicted ATPase